MRVNFTRSILVIQLLALSNLFGQTVVVQEDFTYDAGPLSGLDGGIGFTTPWSVTTTNNNGLLSNVDNGALFSNPDGVVDGNINNDSTAERSFVAIDGDALEVSLDYNLISDNEGSYRFEFILFDSSGVEVFSAGISNDTYQITFANGQSVSQNINNNLFDDTLTLSLDFSGSTSTLAVDSTAFNTLDTVALTSSTSFDFTTGGTIQVQSALLDQNQISVDNILITVPEPSSFILLSCAALIPICRRSRPS